VRIWEQGSHEKDKNKEFHELQRWHVKVWNKYRCMRCKGRHDKIGGL
jgi:hypothetical protein